MTTILTTNISHAAQWDAYVNNHPHASVYHNYAFKQTIEKTYGHTGIYLAAFADDKITGVLPLFVVSGLLFGKTLVSIPFCDYGGLLYDSDAAGLLLLQKAIELLHETKCDVLELRQTYILPFPDVTNADTCEKIEEKVRMSVALPATSDALFASFPAKLRSQIRKPQKDGCSVRSGSKELLDDFYTVFVYNMRDLGSPVHPKKMMANMLEFYGDSARLFVVYKDNKPIGCSLVAGFQKSLVNPWASFNKNYRASAPNMMLYWSMLEFAIANGYTSFDFGRSTQGEGTYKFKEQWGAKPMPLAWYYIYKEKKPALQNEIGNKKKLFIKVWQKLPLCVTRIVGPVLRKQIPL